jgi:predicted nucleic acid-binding protein
MILLDTNVISELMRLAPDRAVERWLKSQPASSMFLSAITEAELRLGLALLPEGKRRSALSDGLEAMFAEEFREQIIPFDSAAAVVYAQVVVERRRAGRPISEADAQIAATAKSRGAAVATRNVLDFEGCGVEIINPWEP